MYGFTDDKNKEFTNFCADFLQKNRQKKIDNPELSKEQKEGANAAKAELVEKKERCPLITIEDQNFILKKHLFETSNGSSVTPAMVKEFNAIALFKVVIAFSFLSSWINAYPLNEKLFGFSGSIFIDSFKFSLSEYKSVINIPPLLFAVAMGIKSIVS